MQSSAKTVKEFIDSLPADRKKAITTVRKTILKNLPKGFAEEMSYGMISYNVPLKILPDTYNGKPLMYAGLASQKNHMSLHLLNIYGDKKTAEWFIKEYKASGKKFDAGKGCVRFKKLEDLPLELVGKVIAKTSMKEYIKYFKKVHGKT